MHLIIVIGAIVWLARRRKSGAMKNNPCHRAGVW